MSAIETLLRHKLIVNKLRVKPMTWDELDDYLERESEIQGYKLRFSQRTFQRHIADILTLYGIEIVSNRSTNRYYIDTQVEHTDRSLEAFDVLNVLRVGNNTSREMVFEKRRPKGTEHLAGVLHGIRNNLLLLFAYHKFYEEESESRRIIPYVIKESKNRWYVIGHDLDRDATRVFAIDRISELEFGKRYTGRLPKVDIDALYRHSFGIILPREDQKVEEIVLSYSAFQGKYVKSMPLHESQEVLLDDEDEVRIRLQLYVTHDLIMEILSVGAEVKVLEPQSLADIVRDKHKRAL